MITSRFATIAFVICLLLSAILVVHLLFGFITPVVMAMVIVSLFNPVYRRLLTIFRQREYLAACISTILVLLGVLIPLTLFFIILAQQALLLFQKTQGLTSTSDIFNWLTPLKGYLDSITRYVANFGVSISSERILKFAETFSQAIGQWIYASAGLIATNLLSLGLNFFLTIALVFVFFVRGQAAKHFIMDLIPIPESEKERLARRFSELASAVFVGNGMIGAIEGTLGGLSFFACGVSGALIWGVIMAITSFLPVVGASVVVLPATIYLFLMGQNWQAIVFFVFNGLQLLILETVVKPRVIGTKSQMHAALVFMSVLAGIQIYGAFGLFYGPLVVTVFLVLAEIYKEHYRDELLKP